LFGFITLGYSILTGLKTTTFSTGLADLPTGFSNILGLLIGFSAGPFGGLYLI
jgi:hypothetical protein